MNWNNIDLNSPYERSQYILDGYNSETLLLEINCNIADITKEAIREEAILSLRSKFDTAVSILEANLDNYLNEAQRYRAIQ